MYFSASKLTGGYGGVNIIEDCSFNVNRGEIVSILGPNGAGKSTAMKAMLGLLNLTFSVKTQSDTFRNTRLTHLFFTPCSDFARARRRTKISSII